jgi:hypothetical protein
VLDLDAARRHFLALVDQQPVGCWLWKAPLDRDGYGRCHLLGRTDRAHRVSYRLFVGEIPDGLNVLHTCDTPACVRPDHLWAGTQIENIADRDAKGRAARGERNGRAKLTWPLVREIRRLRDETGLSFRKIAARFGVCHRTVFDICSGKLWPEPATMPVMELYHAPSDSAY